MDEYDEWVQCCKCAKWRKKEPIMKVSPGWHCKLNVFSTKYNSCSSPQEEMPTSDDEDSGHGEPSPPREATSDHVHLIF